VGTCALRVAGARQTSHRGHPEAVVFHAVDLAIETGEICEHKRGRSRMALPAVARAPSVGDHGNGMGPRRAHFLAEHRPCSRRLPASARASLRLPGAAEARR
jgi:hypothetical protein